MGYSEIDGTPEFRPLDKDDFKILGNDKQIGRTVRDNGIVVPDNFQGRFEAGEITKTYDELLEMPEELRRAELMAGKSKRLEYMGATPGKSSKQGQEVIEKMRQEGKIRDEIDGTFFQAPDKMWYPLKEADMAHKHDAVTWWNNKGRKFGAKADEVREFMLNPKNYELDHFRPNRSKGSKLGKTENGKYLPPI